MGGAVVLGSPGLLSAFDTWTLVSSGQIFGAGIWKPCFVEVRLCLWLSVSVGGRGKQVEPQPPAVHPRNSGQRIFHSYVNFVLHALDTLQLWQNTAICADIDY